MNGSPSDAAAESATLGGFGPATYGDAFADVYDDWYDGISDLDGTVDALVRLGAGRVVLELGVGTGRVALPLARRGVTVVGIDASQAMLDQLRSKDGAGSVVTIHGDMRSLDGVEPRSVGVVVATFNTFFNLTSEADQRRCLARCGEIVDTDGHLVIEAFVPSPPPAAPEGHLDVRAVTADGVALTATWRDPITQVVTGQHVDLTAGGVRLRPWQLRYASPDELDGLAADAGFSLVSRTGGWRDEPFDTDSDRHVSVYRRDRS